MSTESLAYFRRHRGEELQRLADRHFEHDLQPEDRETVKKAAGQFSTWTAVGSIVGLSAGLLLTLRFRAARLRAYEAFKLKDKPTGLQFANGRVSHLFQIASKLESTNSEFVSNGNIRGLPRSKCFGLRPVAKKTRVDITTSKFLTFDRSNRYLISTHSPDLAFPVTLRRQCCSDSAGCSSAASWVC
jgi:hypothetical protein